MSEPEAPEELLAILYEYLRRGDEERAIELFRKHSQENQFETFLNMVNTSKYEVYDVGEYIVVLAEIPNRGNHVFVIGLDDNYNFFCHNLPEESASRILPGAMTASTIRNEMGFDYHVWEISEMGRLPRARIRIQGDVVITIEEIFQSEDELLFYLYTTILEALFRVSRGVFLHPLPPIILRTIRVANCKTIEDMHRILRRGLTKLSELTLHRILKEISKILPKYVPKNDPRYIYGCYDRDACIDLILQIIDSYVRDAIRDICESERILNIHLGNHQIKIIGVLERNIRDTIGGNWDLPQDRIRIYVLRPHVIVALHDEHKSASLEVPMCILSVSSLRVGPLQVTRHRRVRIRSEAIMRLKVAVVDLCGVDPRMILPIESFFGFRGYMDTVGSDIFVRREVINVDSLRILLELAIFYMRPDPRFEKVIPLLYRGARICAFIIDPCDKDAIKKLSKQINLFWISTRGSWPIVIAEYKSEEEADLRSKTFETLDRYIKSVSRRTVAPSRYIWIRRQDRNILMNTIRECISDIIRHYIRTLRRSRM